MCDATCATRAPGVVAAGDVARWHHEGYGERLRIEHWTNAVEQAEAAAARLLGGDAAAALRPGALRVVGPVRPEDPGGGPDRPARRRDVRSVHGTLAERRFVALFGRGGRLRGALAINRVRQLMGYRRMMREGASFEEAVAKARET